MKLVSRLLAIALPAVFFFQPANAESAQPTPVTTKPLAEVLFFPLGSAPASAISLNNTEISAEISGVVTELRVRVGDIVEPQDIVAVLDCSDHEIQQKQALAAFVQAKSKLIFYNSQLANAKALLKNKSVSKEDFNERSAEAAAGSAEVDRLRALLDQAQLRIEKCQVRIPFGAVVVERLASVGELATPGTKLVRIMDKDNVEVRAYVQEADLESLQRATELQFFSGRNSYPVSLRTVLPMLDSVIRSFEVRLDFSNIAAPPGAVGRLEWTSVKAHLPPDLLVQRGDSMGIFREENGTARFTPIADAREGRVAKVDLDPNISIILDGRHGLQDGDPVKPLNP